jgi:hypothetical protein
MSGARGGRKLVPMNQISRNHYIGSNRRPAKRGPVLAIATALVIGTGTIAAGLAGSAPASAAGGGLAPDPQRVNCGVHALGAGVKLCGKVTFTNTTSTPVTVSRVAVDGDTADFGVNGVGFAIHCAPGMVIPPGEFCGLNVVFLPNQTGRRSARLIVEEQTSGGSARVGVAGRGTN